MDTGKVVVSSRIATAGRSLGEGKYRGQVTGSSFSITLSVVCMQSAASAFCKEALTACNFSVHDNSAHQVGCLCRHSAKAAKPSAHACWYVMICTAITMRMRCLKAAEMQTTTG